MEARLCQAGRHVLAACSVGLPMDHPHVFRELLRGAVQRRRAEELHEAGLLEPARAAAVHADGARGAQLEACLVALRSVDADAMLRSVREEVIASGRIIHEACLDMWQPEPVPGADPEPIDHQQAVAASLLNWGWPKRRGYLAIVVGGPVWQDALCLDRQFVLAWSVGFGVHASWLEHHSRMLVATSVSASDLVSEPIRYRLQNALVDGVRSGVIHR
jgi:hypothetical protein